MKTTWMNGMKSTVNLKYISLLAITVLSSCGQNSHMTLDEVKGPVDTTAPTATLSGGVSGVTNTALQTITVTFSEAVVAGISAGDFDITNGTLSNLNCIPALAPTSCTFDVTASGQGAVNVQMPAGAVQDAAGNNNDASNVIAWTFDSVGPTVSIAVEVGEPASGSSTNDSSIALTLTASEALAGVVAGDFTCTNCTVSGISGSGTSWTLNVIPSGLGAVSVELAASAVQDGAGNSNTLASNALNWTYNNVAPAFTLAPASGAPASGSATNISPVAVELSSSAAVTGLVAGDIVCTGCTINSFSGSGASYSFDVLPSGQGAFSVNVPSSVAEDAATNQNTASNTLNWSYDTSAPSATLAVGSGGAASGSTTNAASIPITVSMGESVTGLIAGDFTCTNCTLSGFSGSGSSYSFNVVPTTSGAVSVQLPAGSAVDAAGNGNAVSNTLNWTYDNTAPTVVLSGTPLSGYANSAQTITATFSEVMNVSTLSSADVSVSNGSVSAFSCLGNPTVCTFTVTPTASGAVTVAMSASVAQDNAGNNNTAATNISWTHDTTAPGVVINQRSTQADPALTLSIEFDVVFSEVINTSTFTSSDISQNGTASGITWIISNPSSDGINFILSATAVSTPGTLIPSIALGTLGSPKIQDLSGNHNQASTSSDNVVTYSPGLGGGLVNKSETCSAVATDASDNVYCAGYTTSSFGELAGSTDGNSDLFIMKLSKAGDLIWIKQAGNPSAGGLGAQILTANSTIGGGNMTGSERCNSLAVDNTGNVYCGGAYTGSAFAEQSANGGNQTAFVMKLDSDGNLLWLRGLGDTSAGGLGTQVLASNASYGGGDMSGASACYGVAVDSSGNVYCGGTSTGALGETQSVGGQNDLMIMKLDSSGNLLWIRQAGLAGDLESGTPPCGDNDFDGFDDCDPFGTYVPPTLVGHLGTQVKASTVSFGGGDTSQEQWCSDIALDTTGNVYCGGWTYGNFAETAGGASDIMVVKLDVDGNLVWVKQAGDSAAGGLGRDIANLTGGNTSNDEPCRGIAVAPDGSVYCSGDTTGPLGESSTGRNGFLIKLNSSGDLAWLKQAGDPLASGFGLAIQNFTSGLSGGDLSNNYFYSPTVDPVSGNILMTGETGVSLGELNGGNTDTFVISVDPTGNLNWLYQIGSPTAGGLGSSLLGANSTWSGGDPGGPETSQAVALDSDGNVIVGGFTSGNLGELNGGESDLFVYKLDSSGGFMWMRQAGDPVAGGLGSQLP